MGFFYFIDQNQMFWGCFQSHHVAVTFIGTKKRKDINLIASSCPSPALSALIELLNVLSLTHFPSPSSEVELLLLEERELWPAEEGWLTFDLTATTNLWLEHPGQNLGLHLVLEDSRSECSA